MNEEIIKLKEKEINTIQDISPFVFSKEGYILYNIKKLTFNNEDNSLETYTIQMVKDMKETRKIYINKNPKSEARL